MTKKDESQVIDKKPIAPILKKMKVGGVEIYPSHRLTVVKSTANLLSRNTKLVFKTKLKFNDGVIIITRTA